MIKTAMRFPNNIVLVFDNRGKQIPEYQEQYEEVKESILRDAPPDAEFYRCFHGDTELKVVPRERW